MFELRSSSFANGGEIPIEFTQYGGDMSPSLDWVSDIPGVVEFAVLCEDCEPHRTKPVVHWLIYGINSDVRFLPEKVPTEKVVASLSILQGLNSKSQYGYMGPKPPRQDSPHRYFFRLFAFDQFVNSEPGLTKEEFFVRAKSHVVAEAEMIGTYRYKGVDVSPGLLKKTGIALQNFFAK